MPRKKGRLSQEQLTNEVNAQLRDNSKEVLQKFWTSIKNRLDAQDNRTIEMVGRMFQYDKGPGGVTIFNQHLQVNGAAQEAASSRVRSFDQIIGKLEEQENLARQNRLLNAPVENSDEDAEEIEEAEIEDLIPESEEVTPEPVEA